MVNKMTKKLIIIFFALLICFCFIIILLNRDKIIDYFINEYYNAQKNETISSKNDYTKNYKEINTFKDLENPILNDKNDIINLFYTVLNRGIKKYTFYCPKDYVNCPNDVKTLANNADILGHIDNYINPLNSYHYFYVTVVNQREISIEVNNVYTEDEINKIITKVNTIFNELNITDCVMNFDTVILKKGMNFSAKCNITDSLLYNKLVERVR